MTSAAPTLHVRRRRHEAARASGRTKPVRLLHHRDLRLADFIRSNHETFLGEWETFARTLLPAAEGVVSAPGLVTPSRLLLAHDLFTDQQGHAHLDDRHIP
jgi:dihydrodipicolinate synthase/N-acetylneuraminate lyase